MPVDDDELDRLLDRYGSGNDDRGAADDPVVSALFRASAAINPDKAFVSQLEGRLSLEMSNQRQSRREQPGSIVRFVATCLPAQGRAKRKAHWLVRVAAVAALLVAMVAATAHVRPNSPIGETPISAYAMATPPFYPPASDCPASVIAMGTATPDPYPANTDPYFSAIPIVRRPLPNNPAQIGLFVPESTLPSGAEPDGAVKAAIEANLVAQIACRNAGAALWPSYLASAGILASPSAQDSATATTAGATAAKITPIPVPGILSMSVQPNDNVLVLLSSDWYGVGVEMYVFYTKSDGVWLATDFGFVAPDAWLAAGYHPAVSKSITITMDDTYMWPTESAIPANEAVQLTIANAAKVARTLTITQIGLSVTVQPGQTATFPLNVPANGYLFSVDIDPASYSPSGGYIWAVDQSAGTPTATP